MTDAELRRALRRAAPPDAEAARERARAVVLAAHSPRVPVARRRRLRHAVPIALAFVFAVAAGAGAATAPVRHWVRDLVQRPSPPGPAPAPAIGRLPGGGRLLVVGPSGAWVVHADGGRRRLGAYTQATWSPRGLFVGATRGHQLVALEPGGRVRWALDRPQRVTDARWAPTGFRVAYRSGSGLRVVAGDGSGDRALADRVRPVAPAWRPAGARNELAYVAAGGRIVVTDVDTRRVLARFRPPAGVRRLAWSAGGTRLLVVGERGAWLLSASGRTVRSLRVPAGSTVVDAALAPRGDRVALVRRTADGRDEVLLGARRVFGAAGAIGSVTWAPDGRHVLVDWAGVDQWLFLPAAARGRPARAVAGIAAQFDPGRAIARTGARVEGWSP